MLTRYKLTTLLVILLILLITGCQSVTQESTPLEELTSDEYEGRLVGTEGNEKAAKYLARQFSQTSFLPLNGDYYDSYLQLSLSKYQPPEIYVNNTKIDIELEPRYFVNEGEYSARMLDKKQNMEEPFILLTEKYDNNDFNKKGLVAIIEKRDTAINYPYDVSTANLENIPRFVADETGYTILQSFINEEITIQWELSFEEVSAKNVVMHSPIDPLSLKKIIVISAHFDHLGKTEKGIYRGAVDNASGVEALLQIAKGFDEIEIPKDAAVFFVAFNGEETGLKGSNHFVTWLKEKYPVPVFAFNLDVLGIKGDSRLAVSGSDSLINRISTYFNGHGINIEVDPLVGSDHLSFIEQGFEAITITDRNEDYRNKAYSTPEDTLEWVDQERIKKLTSILIPFLQEEIALEMSENTIPNEPETIDFLATDSKLQYPNLMNEQLKLSRAEGIKIGEELNYINLVFQEVKTNNTLPFQWPVLTIQLSKDEWSLLDGGTQKGEISFLGDKLSYYHRSEATKLGNADMYFAVSDLTYKEEQYYVLINSIVATTKDKIYALSEEDFIRLVEGFSIVED